MTNTTTLTPDTRKAIVGEVMKELARLCAVSADAVGGNFALIMLVPTDEKDDVADVPLPDGYSHQRLLVASSPMEADTLAHVFEQASTKARGFEKPEVMEYRP